MMPKVPEAGHQSAQAAQARTAAWIGIGANLGDRGQALAAAVHAMGALPHTEVCAVSSLYVSAPVDATGPDYLNAVVQLDTSLPALDLLHALQSIELAAGRERPYRNAPRTLDLDVLWYGDLQCSTPELTLPHPRWDQRAFVLLPLAELAPQRVSAAQLAAVQDQRIARMEASNPPWWRVQA